MHTCIILHALLIARGTQVSLCENIFFVSVGETRIVFSKLEGPLPSPAPITISDDKPELQPSAAVGETVTLRKVENTPKPVDQDKSPPKKPTAEVQPSDSWVIVKSESERYQPSAVEARERAPSGRESFPVDQPPPIGDAVSQASDAQEAWSESSRKESSTLVAQAPSSTPSRGGGGGGGNGSEVVRESIEVEDIEEREEEDKPSRCAGNLIFSFDDEEGGEKFSTPSAATPQVSSNSKPCTMISLWYSHALVLNSASQQLVV